MTVTVQTIVTITSLLLNVKEVHSWFTTRTLQQKATVLWHVYMVESDVLLATLWWCMRADGGFSQWTSGVRGYAFWAFLGLKTVSQFPVQLTPGYELPYLLLCFGLTVAAHFPFVGWSMQGEDGQLPAVAAAAVALLLSCCVYVVSELTFRLQCALPICAHTEIIAIARFGLEWAYFMWMVLPYSAYALQLPDYFLLGYATRIALWLAYTATISKASGNVRTVEWLQFHPVVGAYEELGSHRSRGGRKRVEEVKGVGATITDVLSGPSGGKHSKHRERRGGRRKKHRQDVSSSEDGEGGGEGLVEDDEGEEDEEGGEEEEEEEEEKVKKNGAQGPKDLLAHAQMVKGKVGNETVILIKSANTPAVSNNTNTSIAVTTKTPNASSPSSTTAAVAASDKKKGK